MKPDTYAARIDRLRGGMKDSGLGALLVVGAKNVRYLSGFSGEDAVVLVLPDEGLLLTDSRFRLQAQEESVHLRIVEPAEKLSQAVPGLVAGVEGAVGLEAEHLTLAQWQAFQQEAPRDDFYHPVEGLVSKLRRVKDAEEIELMRASGALATAVMEYLTGIRVVGRTEVEVALDLEVWLRRRGSEGLPFPFIVAHGEHGARPHAVPRNEVIAAGRLLVVDLGAVVQGYASDITRTFATGPLSERELEMYEVVKEAQAIGRAGIRPGMSGMEADRLVRDVVESGGMGSLFEHSLGHGVGLDVHEAPRLGPKSEDLLEVGNVVTVEPGVYDPGLGGVRIEDTVVLGDNGATVLTETTRELAFLH